MKTTFNFFLFSLSLCGLCALLSVPAHAQLTPLARVAFTEGPAWHEATGNVYFSDIENNRIMRLDPSGATHVYRTPSGRANGLLFDKDGRLHACEGHREGGNRRVTRTELDGTITVLTDRFEGNRYNSPNDLVLDSKGRIFFTDPRYGGYEGTEILDDAGTPIEGVYRIDPGGSISQIITHEVARPNGIALSVDEKYLIVADNKNDSAGDNRKLWRFDLNADGTIDPESRKLLFDWGTDRGPDGICIDPKTNRIYATAGFNFPALPAQTAGQYQAGVYVFSIEGEPLDTIPVPIDMITNCAIGGPDKATLYITAGHKLWSAPLK